MDIHDIKEHSESETIDPEDVSCGIRWTYREVLRGKADAILVVSTAVLYAIVLAVYYLKVSEGEAPLGTLVVSMAKDALQLKADAFAPELAITMLVLAPFILLLWPTVALGVKALLNFIERKKPRTSQNMLFHQAEASRAWTWPWSMAVGAFDFTACFNVLVMACSPVGDMLSAEAAAFWSLIGTVLCLVIAERRVSRVSRAMAAKLPGNRIAAQGVLDGHYDSALPEEDRNEIIRAKMARIINLGVVRSPRHAYLLVKGTALRTRVKLFSAFLNSAIHGMVSAFTFGVAATTVNEVGAVDGKFASGRGEELLESLRQPEQKRPYFGVEAAAVLVTALIAIAEIMETLQTSGMV